MAEPTTHHHPVSPAELADLFGVESPEEISDDLYSDYVAYVEQCRARPEPIECTLNICGHVDTAAAHDDDHGHMCPHDMEALLDAVLHVLGHRSGPRDCYVCYSLTEFEEQDL